MREPVTWAKLERDGEGRVVAALPLIDHCLDVAAAFAAILPAWMDALTAAAGRVPTAQDIARLTVLAALHDLGKANRGFQARRDARVRPIVGHTGAVAALVKHSALIGTAAGTALRDMFVAWGSYQHFAAALAHHGRPLEEFYAEAPSDRWSRHYPQWVTGDDGDPAAEVMRLIEVVRARWPLAWEEGPPLPDAARFVALFAGLVTLADWVGSDTTRFPVAAPHGAEREALRVAAAADAVVARGLAPLETPPGDFLDAFGNPAYGFQAAAAAPDWGAVALIEAETGSGKTEAALWRWLEMRRRGEVDGLFFALPTRAAAVQLHARVNTVIGRVWGDDAPPAILAVPGYLRAGDATGQALPGFAVRWDAGDDAAPPDARWAAERANRFLAARVAVGTIDQALLAALPVKHALFRASVLARSLLVVDEVHASDAYMTGLLERLLTHHVAVGGRALLLSATLGGEARARLLKARPPSLEEAVVQPYPALSGQGVAPRAAAGSARSKRVTVETAGLIADAPAIAARAVAAARAGAAVLVVRNTVDGAVAVARAVAAMAGELAFAIDGVATVHHGRFAAEDRKRLDEAVSDTFGKGRGAGGRVLVGTQTLEQSLDIDADLLIADLAPMDVLLQRIGRLHRHDRDDRGAFSEARVVVLRPAVRDLGLLLEGKGARHGLGGYVYPNVTQLEATLALLEREACITIPQDNRRLVEQALHREALKTVARERGAAWVNRLNADRGGESAKGDSAKIAALDLSLRFTHLTFREDEDALTRLGARDLLIDLPAPLAGPFGSPVTQVTIPGWMSHRISGDAVARVDERRFTLGDWTFVYDQWGLRRDDAGDRT
ncbi:CRISPR-associated helicase Cas3' [Sphingomonas adhaesiva]|uniref:CRISPR-associated helicase Cas3' n=1 Tax=Sphingomonas adhaesiva TaxID=28212 RepID=UPI002FF64E7D